MSRSVRPLNNGAQNRRPERERGFPFSCAVSDCRTQLTVQFVTNYFTEQRLQSSKASDIAPLLPCYSSIHLVKSEQDGLTTASFSAFSASRRKSDCHSVFPVPELFRYLRCGFPAIRVFFSRSKHIAPTSITDGVGPATSGQKTVWHYR